MGPIDRHRTLSVSFPIFFIQQKSTIFLIVSYKFSYERVVHTNDVNLYNLTGKLVQNYANFPTRKMNAFNL